MSRTRTFRGDKHVSGLAFHPVLTRLITDAGSIPIKSDVRPRTVSTLTFIEGCSALLETSSDDSSGYTAYSSPLYTPCACPAPKHRRLSSFVLKTGTKAISGPDLSFPKKGKLLFP